MFSLIPCIHKIVLIDAEVRDGSKEKIWVRVVGLTDDTTLNGVVVKTPQYATYLKLGDRVEFTEDEIEEPYEQAKS